LIAININTKFIQVYSYDINEKPNAHKTAHFIKNLHETYTINNIRADNDPTIWSNEVNNFLRVNNISSYTNQSKFTNRNRVVDRVIRTIKQAVGLNTELQLIPRIIDQIVHYYNNTPHTAYKNKFTPYQVQFDKDLETWYIRNQTLELRRVITTQKNNNLLNYQRGNILQIHIPVEKTPLLFKKRIRNFDNLAEFIDYHHGNVRVRLLDRTAYIELPIFYTKYVCRSINDLPDSYRSVFNFPPR
jgi:hypothetical protein